MSYRDTLRHPVGRRLFASSAISNLGDYIGLGALLLLAYERSGGRVIGPAAIFAVQAVPGLVSGAVAGSWLDQVPRRSALVIIDGVGAAALLLPLLVPGLAPVLGAAAVLGVVRVLHTSVSSAVIAEAIPEDRRGSLLALMGSTEQSTQVLGYLSGGTIAVTVGASPALLADAVTFVIAAAILARAPLPRAGRREQRPAVTAGLREIWSNPVLRLFALLVWVSVTVTALPEVLAPGVTGGDGFWTPLVLAAAPAGQALTMAILGRRRVIERPSFQLTHLAWFSLAFGLAALGRSPGWFALANLLVGSGAAWLLGPQTLFLRVAPGPMMAQITGTMIAVMIAAEGLGTLVFAAIADAASVSAAYWTAGTLLLVTSLAGWVVKERLPEIVELDGPDLG